MFEPELSIEETNATAARKITKYFTFTGNKNILKLYGLKTLNHMQGVFHK